MEVEEIEKIREYIKQLKDQLFDQCIYMPDESKVHLPEYVGKNLFWLMWKNKDYTIEKKKGILMFSFRRSSLTVTCHMDGFWCSKAYGFNDEPFEEPESLTTKKLRILYTSLLLSPSVTKEDIINILGLNMQEVNLSLIDDILTK